MDHKRVQFNAWTRLMRVAAAVVLTLIAVPVSASVPADTTTERATGQSATQATCVPYQESGVLGREGGLLALRSADRNAEAVTAIITSSATSLRTTRNGGSPTHVSFSRTDCLGREGGLFSAPNR